ncbi:MAG: ATP-binding protein [Anaerolineaceae bacterium]|nr:ATP-binding protein [Anaerolineaceae bacterium]
MLKYPADLLFFHDTASFTPKGWHETLSVLRDPKDTAAVNALLRHLVSFASDFSLSGNIWQFWLTHILMTHENAFTLTCERQHANDEATLLRLAEADYDFIKSLFTLDLQQFGPLQMFSSYQPLNADNQSTRVGNTIKALCSDLVSCSTTFDFMKRMAVYYENFGVGIYGLYKAFRISDDDQGLNLVPVTDDTDVTFDDLIGLEMQKQILRENTEAFLNGFHANNVLLYGDSGTGKSTSIHALMHDYFDKGLRLVELSKQDRRLLPQVLASIKKRNYHFIIYLDDLSFEENESDYKELKAMLEGALEKRSDRILIYATSNRRHLIRETWTDRNDMEYQNDIHHSDTMEEKLSLASRFGITIYYSKPNAKEYLHIVNKLAERNKIELDEKDLNDRARQWELRHGGMSGRTASQLINWLSGEAGIKNIE